MRFRIARAGLIAAVGLLAGAASAAVPRNTPGPEESTANLRDTALGVLAAPVAAPLTLLRRTCLRLPTIPENELAGAGPSGDAAPKCRLIEYRALSGASAGWAYARYRLEREAPSPAGAATWEEVVLTEPIGHGRARAVWHARFDTGEDAIWRSLTPSVSKRGDAQILVSIGYCLNGTGGCTQEFLARAPDGRWSAVRQVWLKQLPPSYWGHLRHGFTIDPESLKGEAGFYIDGDPNCCPSQTLRVDLALKDGAMVLLRQAVDRPAFTS